MFTWVGFAILAIDFEKRGASHIKFVCLVSYRRGESSSRSHLDVIFTAALDDHLNEHGYIVPGLGDAGDRLLVPNKKPFIISPKGT